MKKYAQQQKDKFKATFDDFESLQYTIKPYDQFMRELGQLAQSKRSSANFAVRSQFAKCASNGGDCELPRALRKVHKKKSLPRNGDLHKLKHKSPQPSRSMVDMIPVGDNHLDTAQSEHDSLIPERNEHNEEFKLIDDVLRNLDAKFDGGPMSWSQSLTQRRIQRRRCANSACRVIPESDSMESDKIRLLEGK